MRGGRNKFGPMYKYDRALRQQALHQRQLLAHGLHRACDDDILADPGVLPDIKPDLSMLPTLPPSRVPVDPHPAVSADVSSSPREFYLTNDCDPRRLVAESTSSGPYPQAPPPPRVRPDTYAARQHQQHRQYVASMSYNCDPNTSSVSFAEPPPMSNMTPLAGLSHMTNDISNFVSLSPDSRLHRNYLAGIRPRTLPSRPAVPLPYQLPICTADELRQPQLNRVPPASSFAPPFTQPVPPFPSYRLPQVPSSRVLEPPPSRVMSAQQVSDALPGTPTPTPVMSSYPSMSLNRPPLQPNRLLGSPSLSDLLVELRRNEPNRHDVQKRLSGVLATVLEGQRKRPPPSSLDSPTDPDLVVDSADRTVSDEARQRSLEVVCKMCDQMLFMMVEWARGARFFRELKVDSQMKLLQNSWSELLILNLLYLQTCHDLTDVILLMTGDMVSVDILGTVGLSSLKDRLGELVRRVRELRLDVNEYICLKYVLLLNPDVSGLESQDVVERVREQVNGVLMEYCATEYSDVRDKFGQLLVLLHELRLVSLRVEEFLYSSGAIADNTLLMEMLHARRF